MTHAQNNRTIIDLNADIGEALTPEGQAAERDILSIISSASIACGGHVGNEDTMGRTIMAALENSVSIGAHPAYPDPEHFGRRSMQIGADIERDALFDSLCEQIHALETIAKSCGAQVKYIKPHGALYNDAVKSPEHATLICDVIHHINPDYVFLGGPNSHMEKTAKDYGLRFVREGFIDRRYTNDGHLQSRAIDGAVIKDQVTRMAQTRRLVTSGEVKTASGGFLNIKAQSLCLHGDSAGAVETARLARATIEAENVHIKAFV